MALMKKPLKFKLSDWPYYLAPLSFSLMLTGALTLALDASPAGQVTLPVSLLGSGVVSGFINLVAFYRHYARSGSVSSIVTEQKLVEHKTRIISVSDNLETQRPGPSSVKNCGTNKGNSPRLFKFFQKKSESNTAALTQETDLKNHRL